MHRSNVFCGLSLSCEYWAKKYYLINLASASSIFINIHEPFQALSMFLLNQQTCLLESNSWKDPTMRRLFQIARDALQQSVERETELLDAITNVCDASIKHYEQILNTVERLRYDSPNIRQEVVCGMQKLQQVKRRFEEVGGLQEPTDQGNLATSADEERYQNTMEYVEKYIFSVILVQGPC